MARITYEGIRDGGRKDTSVCLGLHNATRWNRDRWLDIKKVTRREKYSERKVCASLLARQAAISTSSDRDERDAEVVDTESPDNVDNSSSEGLFWVPFVHFGV